jgi:hypothetical protein
MLPKAAFVVLETSRNRLEVGAALPDEVRSRSASIKNEMVAFAGDTARSRKDESSRNWRVIDIFVEYTF